MKCVFAALVFLFGCLSPALVTAQEAGKVGVTISFPSSVGIIWHASEKVAVRPDFSFAHSSSETSTSEGDSDSFALGFSVLFYTKKWDNAAVYIVPRFGWARASTLSVTEFSNFLDDTFTNETISNSYVYSGAFGAQGWIGSRFSAFGEVGLSYSTSTIESERAPSEFESRGFGLRSGVGVAFYF